MILIGLGVLAGAYLVVVVWLYLMQSRMVYFPSRQLEANPNDYALQYQDVSFKAADGVALHGWFVPAENEKGVVLLFHGNGGNVSHRLDLLVLLNRLDVSTFIFDYRGYGRSGGRTTEQGTYLDAEAAWEYLTATRGVQAEKIILHGRSLGGAVAARLATKRTPRAMIVESCFTSVPDLGAELYPMFPVRLLSRFKYDAQAYLRQVSCPVLIIHSRDDDIVPFRHGRRLFQAANEPKAFLEITGGHNDSFIVSEQTYTQRLGEFFAEHFGR